MHNKPILLFKQIWKLVILPILAISINCSDTSTPTRLNPGLQKINQKPIFINSLGMQFIPLAKGKTWLSVWETRVQDYTAYATTNNIQWKAAWFQDSENHPAVNMKWEDAQAFCAWLTKRERQTGLLNENEGYRLPTTIEWRETLGDVAEYPPTPNSGNFGVPLKIDPFPKTSPAGSFPSNSHGVHDLRGNVWEWCIAWPKQEGSARILQGGSWRDKSRKLLNPNQPLLVANHVSSDDYGFRCLLVLNRPTNP